MSPKEALVTVLKDDMIIIRDKFCAIQSLNLDLVSMVDDSEILRDIRTQVWSVFEGKYVWLFGNAKVWKSNKSHKFHTLIHCRFH